jgi:hypothetical protein
MRSDQRKEILQAVRETLGPEAYEALMRNAASPETVAKASRIARAYERRQRVALLCGFCRHRLDQMSGQIPPWGRILPACEEYPEDDDSLHHLHVMGSAYSAGLIRGVPEDDLMATDGRVVRMSGLRFPCKHCGKSHPVRADRLNAAYAVAVARPRAADRVIELPIRDR